MRGGRVALGHRRLAIVDLSDDGRQPMTNETGTLWLTYNGEIYNYPDLRIELERAGHVFASRCDAEVVLHAYEEWGRDCVARMRGIFAFGLWDDAAQSLWLARDHAGVKPLYYATDESGGLTFASQPRAILADPAFRRRPHAEHLIDYLSYGVVPEDRTAFEGMKKLPGGTSLTWNGPGRPVTVGRYWTVRYDPVVKDFDEAVRVVGDQIDQSVRSQLMADVPVATYLSGGIDSSVVTAVANRDRDEPLQALTVGFEDAASDERPYAREVARHVGASHHERVLNRQDCIDLADELADTFDEPYALGSAFPMLCIARMTRRRGLKVVLAGDGADELFAGYRHYDDFDRLYRRYGLDRPTRPLGRLRRAVDRWRGRFRGPVEMYFPREGVIHREAQDRMLDASLTASTGGDRHWRLRRYFDPSLGAVTAGQMMDFNTFLVDEILVKVDRATMAHGVEARVPFLDPKLIELAFSIDRRLHYRGGQRKAVLKAAAADWLPPEILTPRKKGFAIPIGRWLKQDGLQRRLIDELCDGYLVRHRFLNADGLRAALGDLHAMFTWQLYAAERWAARWCQS